MAVGLVLFLIGFAGRLAVMVAGVVVLVVVVAELCLREHFAGFRSHSLLLAALPVSAAHVALVVGGSRCAGRRRSPRRRGCRVAGAGGCAGASPRARTRAQAAIGLPTRA